MAQPMQDTDISSSFTLMDLTQNNDYSGNAYCKKIAMDGKGKTNSLQMYKNTADMLEQKCSETTGVELSKDTFPWLAKFNKVMCSSIGSRNYYVLERLLSVYTQHILTGINTCCMKISEIIKLKNHLNSTLIFFHFYWHDIKEHVTSHNVYLNKMSVLLGIYVNMELKTIKPGKYSSKVTAKLSTALWIYLDNSEKHIFMVLLRLKLITKKYTKICDPILTKSFTGLRRNTESITDMDYVRYLLVLKLWKRLKESPEEKKKVNKFAVITLGPRMPKMREELLTIIPKPPVGHENETLWLLQPNVLDLKKACDHFLMLEERTCGKTQFKDPHSWSLMDSNNYQKSPKTTASFCAGNENGSNSAEKRRKFKKHKRMSKLKPGEVILIDLTEENGESSVTSKTKKTKQKSKKTIEWLKAMRRKYKNQKQTGSRNKSKSQVEIADAHSTESTENTAEIISSRYLPISDNKVSESTESCAPFDKELLQKGTHCMNSKIITTHDCQKSNNDLKCTLQPSLRDICHFSLNQDDLQQQNRVLCLMKLLNFVGQGNKDPKAILNLIKETKEQQHAMSSQTTFLSKNKTTEMNVQENDSSLPREKSSIETTTLLLPKECHSSITDTQSTLNQELPTSTDYSVTQELKDRCKTESSYTQYVDCHLKNFRSTESQCSQEVDNSIKHQNATCGVNACTVCCKKFEINPFLCHNNNLLNNTVKTEDAAQRLDEAVPEKKSICDKNVMCMLSDLDRCMDVLNRISEHIVSVHAEKQRAKCSDICDVSTTVSGDTVAETSMGCWTKDIRSLISTGKLDVCDSKDFHRLLSQEINLNLTKLEHGPDEKHEETTTTVSTSESGKLFSHKTNDYLVRDATLSQCNKLSPSFFRKSVFDEETIENSGFPIEKKKNERRKISLIANPQSLHDESSSIFDLQVIDDVDRYDLMDESRLARPNSLDKFEKYDILDSILNGDMTIEDEQEITSDHAYASTSKKSEKSYVASSNFESPLKPLPEESLGTAGLLNSLMDFDLTYLDSPPSDFMYLNVQTVNPRLIKKSRRSRNEDIPTTNRDNPSSELQSTAEGSYSCVKNDEADTMLPRLESFTSKNDASDSGGPKETEFDLYSRQDSLELSYSMMKNTPLESQSYFSSSFLNNTDLPSELTETEKLETNVERTSPIEEISMNLQAPSDSGQQTIVLSPDICTTKNVPSNCLPSTHHILEDVVQPSRKHASLVTLQLKGNPLLTKQNSYSLLSSLGLIPRSGTENSKGRKQARQRERMKVSGQSRSSKRKYRYETKNVNKVVKEQLESSGSAVQQAKKLDDKKLCLRYSQLTFDPSSHQDTTQEISADLSSFHVWLRPKSSQQCSVRGGKNATYKQLNRVELEQLRKNVTQCKKQILLNFHGKSTADVVLEKDSQPEIVWQSVNDRVAEDSVPSKSEATRSCLKFGKKNRKEVLNPACREQREVSEDVHVKPGRRKLPLRNLNTRSSSKISEKQSNEVALNIEETSPKRRKFSSTFLPVLKPDTVVRTVSREETSEKCLISIEKDFACTSRRKNSVVR